MPELAIDLHMYTNYYYHHVEIQTRQSVVFLLPVENTHSHLVGYSQDVWRDGHKMPYTPPPHPRSTVHTRGGGGHSGLRP